MKSESENLILWPNVQRYTHERQEADGIQKSSISTSDTIGEACAASA